MIEVDKDLVRTKEVASLFQINKASVSKLFASSYVGRSGELNHCDKLYRLTKIAKQLSQDSGYKIEPYELYDLIPRQQAMGILQEMGKRRSIQIFCKWLREGRGPRQFKVCRNVYLLRSETIAWAELLGPAGAPLPLIDFGAIAAPSSAVGHGGGGPETSLPKGGMVLT